MRRAAAPGAPRRGAPGRSDIDADAEAFRPRTRGWARALGLNLVLLLVLVGVPYGRGLRRGEESVAAFPAFAACFFGGAPRPNGGLAIPVGDREAYATRVLSAAAGWPLECAGALEAIALPEATFLLPGIKQGEVEVRAAVVTMRQELGSLAARREADDEVPERPLLALARLQAALSTLLSAMDDAHRGARDAITLDPAARLPAPSRIPLRVADGGSLLARADASRLRLLATDASRASLVDVLFDEGRVLEGLVRRPRAARGTSADAERAHLLWVTSDATCAADADACADRLMGLARIDPAIEHPEAEAWLRAHPAGRLDRVVRVEGARAWVVARADGGGVEIRAFSLDWPAADAVAPRAEIADGAEGAPVAGGSRPRWVLDPGASEVLVGERAMHWLVDRTLYDAPLDGAGAAAAEGERAAGAPAGEEAPAIEAGARPEGAAAAPRPRVAATLGLDAERLWTCGDWIVAARGTAAEIVRPEGGAPWRWDVRPRAPLAGPSAEDEPVSLACDDRGLAVAVVEEGRGLAVATCGAAGCVSARPGSARVDGASIAVEGDLVHVATFRTDAAVTVATLDRDLGAGPENAPAVVAACWERGRGFCGPARFVPGAPRPFLVARDGTDVLVLERREAAWRPLRGLGAERGGAAAP